MEIAHLPLLASGLAVFLNLFLNYVLIFGKMGFPVMGVKGAALATCISKYVESFIIVTMVQVKKYPCAIHLKKTFTMDKAFIKTIAPTCWPVLLNEFFWVTGISIYSLVYASIGTQSMAAVSIITSIEIFVMIPVFGMLRGGSIIIGNTIGSGQNEKAIVYGKYLLMTQFTLAIFIGCLMIVSRDIFLGFYKISPQTYTYAYHLMLVAGIGMCLKCSNFTLIASVLRGGGDTRYALVLDIAGVWLIGIPMAVIGAYVLQLPVYWVMALVLIEEVFKFSLCMPRFLSGKWLRNLAIEPIG